MLYTSKTFRAASPIFLRNWCVTIFPNLDRLCVDQNLFSVKWQTPSPNFLQPKREFTGTHNWKVRVELATDIAKSRAWQSDSVFPCPVVVVSLTLFFPNGMKHGSSSSNSILFNITFQKEDSRVFLHCMLILSSILIIFYVYFYM